MTRITPLLTPRLNMFIVVQPTHGEWRGSVIQLASGLEPTRPAHRGYKYRARATLRSVFTRADLLRTDRAFGRKQQRVTASRPRQLHVQRVLERNTRDHVSGERSAVHEAAPHALSGAAGPPPHAARQRVPLPQPGGRNKCV